MATMGITTPIAAFDPVDNPFFAGACSVEMDAGAPLAAEGVGETIASPGDRVSAVFFSLRLPSVLVAVVGDEVAM
jgi:hypothetical protein